MQTTFWRRRKMAAGLSDNGASPSFAYSVIIPVFNEVENIAILWNELCAVLTRLGKHGEVIWVDDASTDGTFATIETEVAALPPPKGCVVQLLRLSSNRGQSAALGAGIRTARGEFIVIMDGDLQNDPADIPKMLERLTDEVDIVAGWRRHREDDFLTRRLPSLIANWLLRKIAHVPIHDLGCGLKVLRASFLRQVPVYGDRHRYLVPLCVANGAVVTEVEVHHRPRRFGKSKYGLSRTVRVLLDSMTLQLFTRFWQRPLHLFGSLGLITGTAGFLCCAYLTFLKATTHVPIGGRPLLLLGVLLIVLGAQFGCFGLLAEILLRFREEGKTSADDLLRVHRIIEGNGAGVEVETLVSCKPGSLEL